MQMSGDSVFSGLAERPSQKLAKRSTIWYDEREFG